jgi:cobyrinic acid a,c-diamide synthase
MSMGFVIAAPASGTGKTTVTLGIMGALSERGYRVQPFKVGPDYIDPGFHRAVTGKNSYNLDSWLMEPETVRYLYNKHTPLGGVSVVEGVMGLYDGHLCDEERGGTAHLSRVLGLPVLLVVDASRMSASAAALVSGFQAYDRNITFLGVILNRVNSEHHYHYLKKKIENATGLPVWGRLPGDDTFRLKSRHLGLIPTEEVRDIKTRIEAVIQAAEANIDIPGMMRHLQEITGGSLPGSHQSSPVSPAILKNILGETPLYSIRIGIARDAAFSFYYHDNLELMEELGVELIPFSPLEDTQLPPNLSGLYLGGGYPEIFASRLEKNTMMREKIKQALTGGMPYFAECGGMMYLCKEIIPLEGLPRQMAGWFDASCRMTERLQRFGYIKLELRENDLFPDLFPANKKLDKEIKAHEFHHSKLENNTTPYLYSIHKKSLTGTKEWQCGLTRQNGVAGYPHFHFYASPALLREFLNLCQRQKPYLIESKR